MKNKIIILSIIISLILITTLIILLPKDKNYKNWNDYVKSYKNNSVNVKYKNNSYSEHYNVKDKILYDGENNEIFKDVLKVYSIDFNKDSYIYFVTNSGKTFYLNNINKSTQEKFELTELGDYKNIINIELKDNKIIAYDVDKNELIMSDKMNTYTGYSK